MQMANRASLVPALMQWEYVDPDVEEQGHNSDDEDYVQDVLPPGLDAEDDFGDGERDAEVNREQAELQMAGDFNRLIGKIQGESVSTNDNSAWQFDIGEDADFDFQDEIRIASGLGKRKTRRLLGQPELSPQVKRLQGDAMVAYVNHQYDKAIPILREVIKIEPASGTAWSTLAQCHKELGEETQALQLEIIGAHLMDPDVDVWRDLGRRSKDMDCIQQAIYCFRKILYIDPNDLDALWDRSYLLKLSGNLRQAQDGFLKILKILPGNPDVLEELRLIMIELDEIPRATKLFQEAFDHYKSHQPNGPDPENAENEFGPRHLIALTDFYNNAKEYEKALYTVRSGARWLNGRLIDAVVWDIAPDDREFDVEGYIREGVGENDSLPQGFHDLDINFRQRLAISRLKLGDIKEAEMHASVVLSLDVLEYTVLFEELADVYFEQGMYTEALRIYLDLAAHDETSSVYILMQIGACHRNLSNFEEAIEVYSWVLSADPDRVEAKTKLAEVYEITGQLQKALDLVNEVLDARDKANAPTRSKVQREGAEGEEDQAAATGSIFDESRRPPVTAKAREVGRHGMTREQLRVFERQRQEAVEKAFEKLDACEEAMLRGEKVAIQFWLDEAGTLVEDYRVTRPLFTVDRYARFRGLIIERRQKRNVVASANTNEDDMASRLQLEMAENAVGRDSKHGVDEFRGISFDRWLLMIVQYSFLLTREGQYLLATEVLSHVSVSNAFSGYLHQNTLRMALLVCAVRAGDHPVILEHNRRISAHNQFNNDGTRLMLATLGGGMQAMESYIDSKFQKAALREVRLIEKSAQGLPLRWSDKSFRYIYAPGNADAPGDDDAEVEGEGGSDADNDGETGVLVGGVGFGDKAARMAPQPPRATKISPVMLAQYGQICLCARSFQSAIWYLLQAYDAQPLDAMICLDLAVACLGRAMQRQVDNRHHLIVEALSFLSKYRDHRTSADIPEEIEFNFARAFQQLGLNSLAVKHYESALDLVAAKMERNPQMTDPGLAMEAAYNLSLMYVTSGSPGLAKALYRRWLSF